MITTVKIVVFNSFHITATSVFPKCKHKTHINSEHTFECCMKTCTCKYCWKMLNFKKKQISASFADFLFWLKVEKRRQDAKTILLKDVLLIEKSSLTRSRWGTVKVDSATCCTSKDSGIYSCHNRNNLRRATLHASVTNWEILAIKFDIINRIALHLSQGIWTTIFPTPHRSFR